MANSVSPSISDETLSAGIQIESAGKPLAKAATSSALGLAQFLDATWLEVVRKHRPDWFTGRSQSKVLALRKEPKCSIEMMARHWGDNGKAMGSFEPGALYLAHFAGVGTAMKVVRAAADTPTTAVFSQKAIAANRSILAGKTCGQVRTWATKKMAAARGRNWVAVYMLGQKPSTPPAIKKIAASTGAAAGGTIATGTQAGWGVSQWLLALGIVAAVGLAVALLWRFWPHRAPNKIEGEG